MTLKKNLFVIFAISLLLVSCKVRKQSFPDITRSEIETVKYRTVTDITESDVRLHVGVLASDSMQGRMSASPYEALAAKYIKERFESLGLKAFNGNYIQTFPMTLRRYFNNSATQAATSQNVVAYLEVNDYEHENEYIVIGAHYDHIGTRMADDSTLLINNGADDNASGVAGLLEIAEKLCSAKELKYNILFAAFGAEELGLIGSNFFCNNPPIPLEKIKFMVNLDMIGRMDSINSAYINTIEPNDKLKAVIDKVKVSHPDINPVMSFKYYMRGSDHSSFYEKQIPVMFFTTGLHNDYHTPADTIGSINYTGEKLLLDFVYDIVISPAMDDCIRSLTSSDTSP